MVSETVETEVLEIVLVVSVVIEEVGIVVEDVEINSVDDPFVRELDARDVRLVTEDVI